MCVAMPGSKKFFLNFKNKKVQVLRSLRMTWIVSGHAVIDSAHAVPLNIYSQFGLESSSRYKFQIYTNQS